MDSNSGSETFMYMHILSYAMHLLDLFISEGFTLFPRASPMHTKISSFQYLIDIAYNINQIGEAKKIYLSLLKQGTENWMKRQTFLRK